MQFTSMLNELVPIWLGRMAYQDAMVAQDAARSATARDHRVRLLGVEHPFVITLGRRGRSSEDLLETSQNQNQLRSSLVLSDRGGQATLHDKGQLVIYPVADLRSLNIGVREWVHALLDCAEATLKEFSVPVLAERQEYGLFTPNGKIAFVGVRISKGISTHGLSINVSNDLSAFASIRSCGQVDRAHDRVINWSKNAVILDVYLSFMRHFTKTFRLTNFTTHDVTADSFAGI